MRTPGKERALVAGFLASEGLVRSAEDLHAVEACRDPESGLPEANVWNAGLAEGVQVDLERSRYSTIGSSCGLCGARTLDELEADLPRAPQLAQLERGFLDQAFTGLRQRMSLFQDSAGVHGSALLRADGRWLEFAEDVGRHNAVDKVLGARLLQDDYPLEVPAVLLVSGRISFELVQKAALGGVSVIAGIGAPTSLAVAGAERAALALFGLVREGCANRYCGSTRLIDA